MISQNPIVAGCRQAWETAGKGTLLLAVSGGADSTALLLAYLKAGIHVEAAHCNFNLRGEESVRDRDFVSSLCNAKKVTLHLAEFDTPSLAMPGESIEMVCRRLRYEFFRSLRLEHNFTRIVLAHNADDNIETFFLNALRGSGSSGLRGMRPDTGELLRPLLPFGRKEILDFLKENDQKFIVDSSNLSSDYRRNFLRNEVLPLIESEWKGCRKALAATIDIQRRENIIITHYVKKTLEGNEGFLSWETLRDFPDALTLIYYFIKPHGGSPVIASEISSSALFPTSGKEWRLADGSKIFFTRRGILLTSAPKEFTEAIACGNNPIVTVDSEVSNIPSVITSCPLSEAYLPGSPEDYIWLPADREMRIQPLGMKGSQSVWKVLKDAGIPLHERDRYMILLHRESEEPVWIPGIKRSRHYLVSPSTKTLFHLSNSDLHK